MPVYGDVKNDVMVTLKISALQSVIEKVTGEKAIVQYYPDYVKISFTPKQKRAIQDYIKTRLQMKHDQGKIRIDILPLVVPPVLSVYGKLIFGGFVLAFMAGKIFSRK